jgi:outer membrane protein
LRQRRGSALAGAARVGLALLILSCGGIGCATARRARAAQKAAPPPGERTLTAAEAGLNTNSALTVDDALRIALSFHPALAQATQNLIAATAQWREAKAAYWPEVAGRAGYSRGTSKSQAGAGGSAPSDSYSAAFDLNLLICDFGRTPAVVRQSFLNRVAAEQSLRGARSDVAFGVRVAFFDLLRAQELVQVNEEAVRQYQAHLDQAQAFLEVGRRIRYDVTKAEVDLGNAQLSLITARNDVVTARAALNRSIGLAEDARWPLGPGIPEQFAGRLDDLMAAARERHPEMLALRAQEQIASAAVDQAVADLYPTLSLGASYSGGGSHLPLAWNWSAALQSALQLFAAGRKTARIDETVAGLRAARARVADREQQIYLDLTTALGQWDSARQRVTLTGLILQQAQESLKLVSERYRVGQASSVELTDAQVAVTSARADRVNARFDLQTAIARIKHAIGEE